VTANERTSGHGSRGSQGVIVYDGPSLLNGERIVAIITRRSNNRKTGDMPQLWILVADLSPTKAAIVGADASVCGRCPLRGDGRHRGCYVDLARAPMSVWSAWRRGLYPDAWATMPGPGGWGEGPGPEAGKLTGRSSTQPHTAHSAKLDQLCTTTPDAPASTLLRRTTTGRVVRLGAYGDPAALPRPVLDAIVRDAAASVGYSHAWRDGFALSDLVMASADNAADAADAAALGFRSFVLTPSAETRRSGHMICPASAESGHRLTCEECRACSGAGPGKPTAHVQIAAHGSQHSTLRYALKVLQA
jgi:hypothetical protein